MMMARARSKTTAHSRIPRSQKWSGVAQASTIRRKVAFGSQCALKSRPGQRLKQQTSHLFSVVCDLLFLEWNGAWESCISPSLLIWCDFAPFHTTTHSQQQQWHAWRRTSCTSHHAAGVLVTRNGAHAGTTA